MVKLGEKERHDKKRRVFRSLLSVISKVHIFRGTDDT